jgi:hypothetical protein
MTNRQERRLRTLIPGIGFLFRPTVLANVGNLPNDDANELVRLGLRVARQLSEGSPTTCVVCRAPANVRSETPAEVFAFGDEDTGEMTGAPICAACSELPTR